MAASKGMTLLATAGSLIVATSSAIAGPSSPLDPYAHIQAPRPQARKAVTPKQAVTRPADGGVPEAGMMSGVKEIGGGFVSTGKGIAGTYKKAGSGVVRGGKFVGQAFVNGTKKMAGGAKASGSLFAKGAKSVGSGVVAAGEKVKDGTAAAGSKVVSLPGAIKGDDSDKPQQASNDLREAPQSRQSSTPPPPQKASAPQQTPDSGDSDGIGSKVVAVPKAIGRGFVAGAGKMKEGTVAGGKKMISMPSAVFNKLLRRGDDNAPATAQVNNGATK